MGQSYSSDGHCGGIVPLHVDPRGYALTKVHKIPARKDLFDMYPEYTPAMACKDLVSYKQTGRPAYALPKYHKILRKGFFGGGDLHDPRHYVLKRVYGLRPEEIANIDRHPGYYTRDMAIQELQWQQARKRDSRMQPFKYDLSRRIRFTNTEHGHVYKPGTKGYKHGFSYSVHDPHFTMPVPQDPRHGKPTKANIERAAYERGIAHGRKEAANLHAEKLKEIEMFSRKASSSHQPSAPPSPYSHLSPSVSMSPSHVPTLSPHSHSSPALMITTIPKKPSADFASSSYIPTKPTASLAHTPSSSKELHASKSIGSRSTVPAAFHLTLQPSSSVASSGKKSKSGKGHHGTPTRTHTQTKYVQPFMFKSPFNVPASSPSSGKIYMQRHVTA